MRSVVLAGVLLGLMATSAFSQLVDISWNECTTATGGTDNIDFGCDTNSGAHVLITSFLAPPNIGGFIGCTSEILVFSNSTGIPAWWSLDVSACRAGTATSIDAGAVGFVGCADPYNPSSGNSGALFYERPFNGRPARARLVAEWARPDAIALAAGTWYLANGIRISSTQTIGTDPCSGCAEPMCLEIDRVIVGDVLLGNIPLANPSSSQCVTWQGGQVSEPGCCNTGDVPARRPTWGGLKALYR
jgi:hypothetical protein